MAQPFMGRFPVACFAPPKSIPVANLPAQGRLRAVPWARSGVPFQATCSISLFLGSVLPLRKRYRPGFLQAARFAERNVRQQVARGARGGEATREPTKVPILLLTGFLGTGKTTLLKHWLENAEGRIGVVVNDVASVNIDAKLVNQAEQNYNSKVDTIQLQNGCACCSLGDELLVTIYDLLTLAEKGEPFSHIVVELSGVAEPKRVRDNFNEAAAFGSELVAGIELSKVVTLLDASTFGTEYMESKQLFERPDLMEDGGEMGDLKVVELLAEQVEDADVVVLNKTDLAQSETLDATRAVVGALNSNAKMCETTFGRVPLSTVLADAVSLEHDTGHEGHQVHGAHKAYSHQESDEHANHQAHGAHKAHSHQESDGHANAAHSQHEAHSNSEDHGHEHAHSHTEHGNSHGVDGHSHSCSDPTCEDPSHSHTHSHASVTTAQDRFGITSFIYSARRPFSSDRLSNVLAQWPVPNKESLGEFLADVSSPSESVSPFKSVLRSKGFCWIDTYPSNRMYWSHAGKSLGLSFDNFWWAVIPESQRQQLPGLHGTEYERARKEDWSDEWEDRRQELVFIGQHMDETGIRAALDSCLLHDGEELEAYRTKQDFEADRTKQDFGA